MFDKILIANRGEIACRVAMTARRLGVRTVAVYSDADRSAKHVRLCDEAFGIGPPPARESYLRGEVIIDVARRTGAQAIHPGYGFLSENEAFARAVADAGLVFIGPPPAAIAAMGSKSAAKALMAKAGVPLVPGYHGDDQDAALLSAQATAIGYPVMIKASAGGGGKGMRLVTRDDQFDAMLASCRREAKNAFGDDHVLVERFVERPRHIEIQVFADHHGNAVSLFERDCSVQRRHQKVIEEAPAPGMTDERRRAMGDAAVAAARAVGYVGAGTVEFIADQAGAFYFMEMNTRLQVEHPVTEMITGQDLVEWQLRVAAGEPLPCTQAQLAIRGHAIEARIYAENADKGFLPSIGRLTHLRTPPSVEFERGASGDAEPAPVRVDSGVRAGDEITGHYDPMIAKLICWGPDRDTAIRRMQLALAGFEVVGPSTNVDFLGRLMTTRAFTAADLDTALIEREQAALFPAPSPLPLSTLAVAAAAVIADENAELQAVVASGWHDPFAARSGWRLNSHQRRELVFHRGDQTIVLSVEYAPDGYTVRRGGEPDGEAVALAELSLAGGRLTAQVGGCAVEAGVVIAAEVLHLFLPSGHLSFGYALPLAHAGEGAGEDNRLTAPMPGKVIALMVDADARVTKGQPLLVMEAMKMEHTICAPADGRITGLLYRVGEQVAEGAQLITFEATAGAGNP